MADPIATFVGAAGRIIRLNWGKESTTWPWPFSDPDLHQDAAWKARYAPETLTRDDQLELAEIANAYSNLITHPSHSLAMTLFVLRRAFKKWANE